MELHVTTPMSSLVRELVRDGLMPCGGDDASFGQIAASTRLLVRVAAARLESCTVDAATRLAILAELAKDLPKEAPAAEVAKAVSADDLHAARAALVQVGVAAGALVLNARSFVETLSIVLGETQGHGIARAEEKLMLEREIRKLEGFVQNERKS